MYRSVNSIICDLQQQLRNLDQVFGQLREALEQQQQQSEKLDFAGLEYASIEQPSTSNDLLEGVVNDLGIRDSGIFDDEPCQPTQQEPLMESLRSLVQNRILDMRRADPKCHIETRPLLKYVKSELGKLPLLVEYSDDIIKDIIREERNKCKCNHERQKRSKALSKEEVQVVDEFSRRMAARREKPSLAHLVKQIDVEFKDRAARGIPNFHVRELHQLHYRLAKHFATATAAKTSSSESGNER